MNKYRWSVVQNVWSFFFLNCCFFHGIVCWGNLGNDLLNDYGLHSQHPTNVLEFYCYPVYFPDIFCTGLESLRFLVPTFWLCLDCKIIYQGISTNVWVWLDLWYKTLDNSFRNNISLFQFRSIKKFIKMVAHNKKITNMK